MNFSEESLKMHEEKRGKIEVISKAPVETRDDLSIAYTPGVAEPCRKINENVENVYKYTAKGNLVAVVTDGSAVLGLGNIGGVAGMPVMEGKSILFKTFAGVDAFPICLDTQDVDEIVATVKHIAPTFGGINLEDIGAPKCFEIEERLKEELDIPVFHDDQHGTAIVVCAGLINALKIVKKEMKDIKAVVNGAGAAGMAITKMLLNLGVQDIIMCDSKGMIYEGSAPGNKYKEEIAKVTNRKQQKGSLKDALVGADVFIGVSIANVVTKEMVQSMKKDAIIFAMANPNPEISYEDAKEAGARVIGTGRSDFPNQINNVLAFPGLFKGALSVRARKITEEMKVAAAYGIASLIQEEDLTEEYVIPDAFDKRVADIVAKAVADKAVEQGVNRI